MEKVEITVKHRLLYLFAVLLAFASLPSAGSGLTDIHSYMSRLAKAEPNEIHCQLEMITDVSRLRKPMTCDEMSSYIKATPWQAKMVYSCSGRAGGMMTPLEFVHSLADDLFSRKSLEHFVSRRQKEGLLIRRDIMDWADKGERFSEERLQSIVNEYIEKTF